MNQFPVRGKHARSPEEVEMEEPLLLHPYHSEPRLHLRFFTGRDKELWGDVEGLTDEGRVTVRVCNLGRGPLVTERRRAQELAVLRLARLIDRWRNALEESMLNKVSRQEEARARQHIFDEIARLKTGEEPFSASMLAAAEEFVEKALGA